MQETAVRFRRSRVFRPELVRANSAHIGNVEAIRWWILSEVQVVAVRLGILGLMVGILMATEGRAEVAATQSADPREVLVQWRQRVYAGEEKEVSEQCWFASEESKTGWEARFGEQMAEQRLRQAMKAVLGDEPASAASAVDDYLKHRMEVGISPMGESEAERDFQTAGVWEDPDQAIVTLRVGVKFYLVKKGGEWKIDCDRTLPKFSKLTQQQLDGWKALETGVEKLTEEVQEKKYTSWTEVRDEYSTAFRNTLAANVATRP
jgi:hypothetical protein